MAKYRVPPKSSTEQHSALQKRVGKLERNPRAPQTSVNNGILLVNGGAFIARGTDEEVSTFGINVNPGVKRVSIARTRLSDNADTALVFSFLDSITIPVSSWTLSDRYGNTTVSDAIHPEATGFGHPRLTTQFFDASVSTTFTSGTFSNFRSCFWYPYSPHLRVTVIAQVDVGTTGEIRLNEQASGPQDLVQLTSGMNSFVDLVCDRRNTAGCLSGNFINGNAINLDLEVHRLTGAGNIKLIFVEAIGIDLSFLWDL